ncbi:hypothetical protein [Entomohabitans teleogrylli]|uniref:hypothetical protein n=1 Tax=Entomohabitans teleogrylli TaxID=1384589 RepID=UPI0012B6932D|nr:hypothetical protein [Entomohabitans teleogrylli]
MEKRKLYRLILAGSAILGGSLFFSAPASAGSCTSNSGGGCPVVTSVTHQSGNNYTVNWIYEGAAQYWVSASGMGASAWGLYLITNYVSSGHYVQGGNYQGLKTVTRSDPVVHANGTTGTDNCTNDSSAGGVYCDHSNYASRFLLKHGSGGTTTVTIPDNVTNSCIVFGIPRSGMNEFFTVFSGYVSTPVCGPGGVSVPEPEPDPEWCGMSTSELIYDFLDMAPAGVAGQSLTRTATMTCSKANVPYNLYLSNISTSGRDTINLGRGVSAKVTVNEQSLQTMRTSGADTNLLRVTVTLSGTPTSTGPIGGQNIGILAVEYY